MAEKRPAEGDGGEPAEKATRTLSAEDEFDELLQSGILDPSGISTESLLAPPSEFPGENARRQFAESLSKGGRSVIDESELPELLRTIREEAPDWGARRHWRSAALLLIYVSRSRRDVRTAFVGAFEGLQTLGPVLQQAVAELRNPETGPAGKREAGMWAQACLTCLLRLPIGRAAMWQHRHSVGKAFDMLHQWCKAERTALAAELRGPTQLLCKKWAKQPKPAAQESNKSTDKALRLKVVGLITQGLNGVLEKPMASPSPAQSPMPPMSPPASPAPVLPPNTVASEVEAALFVHHKGATAEYRKHARMLRSNLALPGNTDLRTQVLSGDLGPKELVALNSEQLAPEAVRASRRAELERHEQGLVLQERLVKPETIRERDDSVSEIQNIAPKSVDVHKDADEQESADKEEGAEGSAEAMVALPTPLRMDPPPTPFRADVMGMRSPAPAGYEEIPDVVGTPGALEDDEEDAQLIRFLSQPV